MHKSQQNFSNLVLNINSNSTYNSVSGDKSTDYSSLTLGNRGKKNFINTDYLDNKEYRALKPHNSQHSTPKIFQFNSSSSPASTNPNFTLTATNALSNANATSNNNSTHHININSKGKLVNLTVKPPLNLSPNFSFLNNEPKNTHRQTAFASYYASLIEQARSNNSSSVIGGEQSALAPKKHRNFADKKSRVGNASHKKGIVINTLQVSDLNDLETNSLNDNNSCNGDLIEISTHKLSTSSNRLVDEHKHTTHGFNDFNNCNNSVDDDSNNKLSKKIIKSSPKLLILKLSKNKIKLVKQKNNNQHRKNEIISSSTSSTTTTTTPTNENNNKNDNEKKCETFLKQSHISSHKSTAVEVKNSEVFNDFHSTSSFTSSCFNSNFRIVEQSPLTKRNFSLPVPSLINSETKSPSSLYQKLLPSLTKIIINNNKTSLL